MSRNQVFGWAGIIRVDGTPYTWMGSIPDTMSVNQTAYEYTSTKSIFTMNAGAVEMKITFLSPVTPDDMKRQSLVFSYLNVEVSSLDGSNHDVQVYADISAGKSPRLKGCILFLNASIQSGYPAIATLLRSGTTVLPVMLLITESIAKLNLHFRKSTSKENGVTGTGRLMSPTRQLINPAKIQLSVANSLKMVNSPTAGTPTSVPSATAGLSSDFHLTWARWAHHLQAPCFLSV